MTIVIDASIALSWRFKEERTPAADNVLLRVRDEGAVAPGLWPLEVANALHYAARRGRIGPDYVDASLRAFQALDIEIDAETASRAWTETLALARAHNLTLYDAAYLELAVRRALPLATLDADLRAAAAVLGIDLRGV